jgi:hypothetical protein
LYDLDSGCRWWLMIELVVLTDEADERRDRLGVDRQRMIFTRERIRIFWFCDKRLFYLSPHPRPAVRPIPPFNNRLPVPYSAHRSVTFILHDPGFG